MECTEACTYAIEELLPAAAKLAAKYTSGESSSVSYETAQMLMEAVIYCIQEEAAEDMSGTENADKNEDPDMGECRVPEKKGSPKDILSVYEAGYRRVVRKTERCRELYEILIENFEDYGCRNYRNTVLKGIPQFFLRYDARFCPQDHLLTLDYPCMEEIGGSRGADKIYRYLKGLCQEKRFLELFARSAVAELLRRLMPDYELIYFENICYQVLLNTLGCMIAGENPQSLKLSEDGYKKIYDFFKGDSKEAVKQKVSGLMRILAEKLKLDGAWEYFGKASADYAARILNGIENDSLGGVFV